jgi:hypothetical protein
MSSSSKDGSVSPAPPDPQRQEEKLFIDDDTFVVPLSLVTPHFCLQPLTGAFNGDDLNAWTSSIQHIRSSTAGFPLTDHDDWPPVAGMSLASNLKDLEQHHDDFKTRQGFTYTVLEAIAVSEEQDDCESSTEQSSSAAVIGCVYMYPDPKGDFDVEVKSWVRASHSHLDLVLREAVVAWLRNDWPCFSSIKYEGVTTTM